MRQASSVPGVSHSSQWSQKLKHARCDALAAGSLDAGRSLCQGRRSMQAVINVVIPVFAIVLAGFFCGRFRLLGAGGSEALNGFVYFAALPALFFGSLAKVELSQIFNWPYLSAYLLGMAATGIAAL